MREQPRPGAEASRPYAAPASWRRPAHTLPSVALAVAAILAVLLGGASAGAAPASRAELDREGFDLKRPEIAAFIDYEVKHDHLSRTELESVLGNARARPELTEEMAHPAEKTLTWWQYRARFVSPERIAAGVKFWLAHQAELSAVATGRGVPAEYLVAILGMETNYGQSTGSYRELDTLMTFAFDYPQRGKLFRKELREFLLLARDAGVDPLLTRGSYGGALGALQFLPSSYRRYAVSGAGVARIDLWNDWGDIFASEANFLRKHGWQPGGPVLLDARVAPGRHPAVTGRTLLNDTLAGLAAQGVRIDAPLPPSTEAVLLAAPQPDAPAYRVAFRNFRAVVHYNPSINYAMAACDLADELRQTLAAASAQVEHPVQ